MDEAVAWGVKGRELTRRSCCGSTDDARVLRIRRIRKKSWTSIPSVTPGHPMYEIGLSLEKALQLDFAGAAEVMENADRGCRETQTDATWVS